VCQRRRDPGILAPVIWHVTLNGTPACTSTLVEADERLEPPVCGTRNRDRAEEYARLLRGRHPAAVVEVVAHGCPMRGE
jgi:hypothetical protein